MSRVSPPPKLSYKTSGGGDSAVTGASMSEEPTVGYLATFMVQKSSFFHQIDEAKWNKETGETSLGQAVDGCDPGHDNCPVFAFQGVFDAECDRVSSTIKSQQEAQELAAKALLSNVTAAIKAHVSSVDLVPFYTTADEMANHALELQQFTKENALILSEIANYADAQLGTTILMSLRRRFSYAPWKEGPNSALVVVLSDIYQDLRSAEKPKKEKKDSKWVAPSSFARSTTKYWIAEDKLTDVLLASVAQAPLLVYGRSGHLTETNQLTKSEGNKLWDELATPINSVYFDSVDMNMYRERIKRSEGAQLFRVRWYGSKPSGEEPVFLELKTHHEKWVNEKSVKERCNILEQDMRIFLSRDPNDWNDKVAKEMVLNAEPKLRGRKLEKQVTLLNTMHNLVVSENLRPCVRSMYVRAAFQSADSNALRLTLDQNVTLVDEKNAPSDSWCLPDGAKIPAGGTARVPLPVFEIKLAGVDGMPDVFQDLIDRGILIEAPKFSKFLSGAAAFNRHKLDELPYWAEEEVFHDMFHPKKKQHAKELKNISRRVSTTMLCSSGKLFGSGPAIDLDDFDEDLEVDVNKPKQSFAGYKVGLKGAETTSAATSVTTVSSSSSKAGSEASGTVKGGPFGLRFRGSGAASAADNKSKANEPKIAPKRRVRVEPKSYFANERTFIQWISAALLLMTVSSILLGFQSETNVSSVSGIVLVAVAVFIVAYAAFTYFRRLKLLESGEAYGYVDHIGPIILAAAVLFAVVLLLYYYIVAVVEMSDPAAAEPAGTKTTKSLSQDANGVECFQRPVNGIPILSYQPSGIYLDTERKTMLVPSRDHVTSFNMDDTNATVEILVEIPGADLEAVTYAKGRVFALSETTGHHPNLYELSYFVRDGKETLEVIGEWELHGFGVGGAEGLTYVPDDGLLYVAGDIYDPLAPEDRGIINTYELPDPNSDDDKMDKKFTLNSNLINSGLDDSKIGDLLYFDGVLYVLNDNERLIRAWDINSGELLYTSPLPRVKGAGALQWEGMFLQRNSVPTSIQTPSLRGSSAGVSTAPLTMHLVLDTPPQVWSFAVNEATDPTTGNIIPGSLVLPACAAA